MLRLFSVLLLISFSLPAQEAAIREVVKRYVDARESRNEAAISALFADDADQLVSNGEWRRGREQLVKGTLASSQQNTGTRTITVETVRFLSPDVAIADGRYEIGDRKMWTTILVTRGKDGWKIGAIRNMLPSPSR